MTIRLDQNRAAAQLAAKLDQPISAISKVTIWGNHSSTQFPDASQATCNGAAVAVDQSWLETEFVPTVQKRGAAVIAARKLSSAMSAAKVIKKPRIHNLSFVAVLRNNVCPGCF